MPTVIYETNHSVPNEEQIKELFNFLLERFPLQNIQKLVIKLQKTRRWYDECNASHFSNFARITMVFSYSFNPLSALKTAVHEYMHVIQGDRGDKTLMTRQTTKRRGGNAHEKEADIFSVEQLAAFLGITPVELLTHNVFTFYERSVPEIERRFGCEIKKKPPLTRQEMDEFIAYHKEGKSLQEIHELQNPDMHNTVITRRTPSVSSLPLSIEPKNRIQGTTAQYRTTTLNLTHPVTVNGFYIDEFIELVSYVLTNKFRLTRPISIDFKPTKTCQRASGEYIACGDPEYPYRRDVDKVIVCTQHHYRDVLRIIAHELKHVEQNHLKLYPSEYQLLREFTESGALFRDRSIHRKKEKEARDCELPTVIEFEEWQKQNGTYTKYPYNYLISADLPLIGV